MFLRMIRGAFARQWKKMLIIALTIMLGTSLATAMINVMLDVGDKVNQELKTYGANITVLPKSASVMSDLYEMEGDTADTGSYLLESEIGNVKTIFWAFNIVDFAPFIDTQVSLESGSEVKLKGTWFNHHLDLPTGESLDSSMWKGLPKMRTLLLQESLMPVVMRTRRSLLRLIWYRRFRTRTVIFPVSR